MKFHAQGFLYHGRCWKEHRKLFSFLMHLETSLNLSIFTVRHQESMQNVNTYMNEMWIKWIPVVSGNTTIRFTSAVLPNPTAQASWDRRRKQKRKKYQLFSLPCNSLFGLIPDFQVLSRKSHLLPCWHVWASGGKCTRSASTGHGAPTSPCSAWGMPCPQPSSLSRYPAPSGKPRTQRHAGSGCHCPFLSVRHDQHASTYFHNHFLFPTVLPLFLDPLTMALCPSFPCFPVLFPFHLIELFPYFCFPAPGIWIFVSFLEVVQCKCPFLEWDAQIHAWHQQRFSAVPTAEKNSMILVFVTYAVFAIAFQIRSNSIWGGFFQ